MSIEQIKVRHTVWTVRYSVSVDKYYAVTSQGLKTGHFRTIKALKADLMRSERREGIAVRA